MSVWICLKSVYAIVATISLPSLYEPWTLSTGRRTRWFNLSQNIKLLARKQEDYFFFFQKVKMHKSLSNKWTASDDHKKYL